jgi:hypothetical protein
MSDKEEYKPIEDCGCRRCLEEAGKHKSASMDLGGGHYALINLGGYFIVCPNCGNKRCPKATDHTYACTNSNNSGQEGSIYG